MKRTQTFKKILSKGGLFLSIVAIFCQLLSTNVAFAQEDKSTGTLLPKVSSEGLDCNQIIQNFNAGNGFASQAAKTTQLSEKEMQEKFNNGEGAQVKTIATVGVDETDTLACAIKTGKISLRMLPYFMKYFANFVLGLVGLVGVLFVVIGGFYYTVAGATDTKEKGKTYITHALIGMAISFLSWTIVNIVLRAVTG